MTNPTGAQYEITSGSHRAVVTEVGATLRSFTVEDRDVVRGFAADEVISGGRGQQLLPWPNRIRDGRYTFAGVTQQLALTEPARRNAIHGLARHVAWTLDRRAADQVSQSVRIYPQPGWPGIVEATISHLVDADGLSVEMVATNIGSSALPFGYAAHPYLTVGEETVDDVTVQLPAARRLVVDERLLPVELGDVNGTPYDLRPGGPLGQRRFDTAFTDLALDHDGTWLARIARGERYAELWAEGRLRWAQLFTGNDRRDLSIAVEPMTCGPDAFNDGPTHGDVIVLQPGEQFSCRWGVTGR